MTKRVLQEAQVLDVRIAALKIDMDVDRLIQSRTKVKFSCSILSLADRLMGCELGTSGDVRS